MISRESRERIRKWDIYHTSAHARMRHLTGENDMNEIKLCPYRTYTEVRPAILKGHGDVTVTGFMNCLREQCPAFRVKGEYSYRLGETEYTEHCLRLEGEKK